MEGFTVLTAGSAMVMTALAFIKHLRGGQTGDALTLLALFAVGVGVAFLICESDFAKAELFGGISLADLNAASRVLLGYAIGSGARVLYEGTNKKTNSEPKLFANPAGTGE